MTSLKQNIWITSISGVISSWTSLLLNSEKDVAPKKRGKTKGTREIIFLSSLSLGDRLQEREEEVVVGGDDEQSGAEVEGDHHAPQVPPGRDARHGADRRHHVEHLQVKEDDHHQFIIISDSGLKLSERGIPKFDRQLNARSE